MRQLRVFGWSGFRSACPTPHRQTREIVAATSKAEVARLAGFRYPRELPNLSETRNENEIAQALRAPRVIFWKPLSYSSADNDWRMAKP